ncbi:MAG: CocE/NonD family hydrolase [Planctomycetes bacterium]|nr:CocE/NonD family hydrolase [Planctomycetota bacterium]
MTRRCPLALLALASAVIAQDRGDTLQPSDYDKQSVMIPMRDGVKLYTELYRPKQADAPLAIVFLRTPYRTAAPNGGFTRYFESTFRVLRERGYVFAVQDARGRHGSEGTFEWNRPVRHRSDPDAIDASTDAHDSIAWLVDNVPGNNGRVGMLGVSYPGWYVTMALVDPHPALACASPQASPSDYFLGDDFFHFGAFRLSPSAELPYLFDFDPKENSRFPYDQVDLYEFFLDLGPLSNMNTRYLHGVSPTWNHFMAHTVYDDYWQQGATLPHLGEVTVPTLNVVGWWDAENLGGALDIYDRLERQDPRNLSHIVVGPWSHGQWASANATSLGRYEFGSDTSEHYQREIEAPWFESQLYGGAFELPEATMFQTGSNVWQEFDQWPPAAAERRALYLHADGSLAFEPPGDAAQGSVGWVSDPDRPVPYTARPVMPFWHGLPGSRDPRFQRAGKLWKVEDQRFASDRPDVVAFTTAPLAADVAVSGHITARLFASTSGTDADWVVKLIDVYPEDHPERELGGYQLMIADDVLRGRFRDGFDKPHAITPGAMREYEIDLRTRNHLFRAGHRIMVQVQSTWFPLIDRNPQTYCDIPNAKPDDFKTAEHRVWMVPDGFSRLELDVVAR